MEVAGTFRILSGGALGGSGILAYVIAAIVIPHKSRY